MTRGDDEQFLFINPVRLPRRLVERLSRTIPGLAIDEVEDAIDNYLLVRLLVEPVTDTKAVLQDLIAAAAALQAAILRLHSAARWDIELKLEKLKPRTRLKDLRSRVGDLEIIASQVQSGIVTPRGRPPSDRTPFIADLARIVREAGHPADSKAKGLLVFLVRELLTELTEGDADARTAVRLALGEKK